MKKCTTCGEEKDSSYFRKSGISSRGIQKYRGQCRDCCRPDGVSPRTSHRVELTCDHCGSIFSRVKSDLKASKSGKYFCCKSCMDSAKKYMTEIRPAHFGDIRIENKLCLNCNKPLVKAQIKYCSPACQQELKNRERITAWLDRELPGHTGKTYQICQYVRRFLLEQNNYSCEQCGFNEPHPTYGTSILEIDHIDGNPSNSEAENLRVLCPNCHAKTDNFRTRNFNSCRARKPV